MRKWFFFLGLFCFLYSNAAYSQTYGGGFLYHFHDASVPPKYHRSYMISIEDTVVKFIVDSYEDVLLDETYYISGDQLENFKKKLKACKLKNASGPKEPNGCTGGTSDSFFFLWTPNSPQDGYTSKCGGKEYGNLKGQVEEARQLFKSMVPAFANKLQSTRLD